MRRYEFHSSLTPEQVFARLDVYAQPWDVTAFGDGTFRFKQKKDGFYLSYTGTLPARGFLPFRGEVRAEEGGSVIAGGFYVRAVWNVMLVGFGFAYMVLRLSFDVSVAAIVILALWALLCVKSYYWFQTLFFKKRQQAVLEFIQQRLLE